MSTTFEEELDDIFFEDCKDHHAVRKEKSAMRIQLILHGLAKHFEFPGEVKMFGSYSNGFKTGTSDLDVVLTGDYPNGSAAGMLQKFATALSEYGFTNVTKIFAANVPLCKFTDRDSGMEVDFCINNDLGVRNSLLLLTYCNYDSRTLRVGRLVKDWAKRHELVGTADGYLNSYAYMLLTIFYLQSIQPPVVPNLQSLGEGKCPVRDSKWGCEDVWDTKFDENWSALPKSENTQSVGELLTGFFHFYVYEFQFRKQAVSIRLNNGETVNKFSLATPTSEEQWYVEDPFDLKHNLAGKCSRAGRKSIMNEMMEAYRLLSTGSPWSKVCPPGVHEVFYLKCRISDNVTPQALLEEFEPFGLTKLYFPKLEPGARPGQAFLEFDMSDKRRRAHTKNETYIADVQLQLHYSTQAGLHEAVSHSSFSTYDMASYAMQRQILAARVQRPADGIEHQVSQTQPHMPQQDHMAKVAGVPLGLAQQPTTFSVEDMYKMRHFGAMPKGAVPPPNGMMGRGPPGLIPPGPPLGPPPNFPQDANGMPLVALIAAGSAAGQTASKAPTKAKAGTPMKISTATAVTSKAMTSSGLGRVAIDLKPFEPDSKAQAEIESILRDSLTSFLKQYQLPVLDSQISNTTSVELEVKSISGMAWHQREVIPEEAFQKIADFKAWCHATYGSG